MTNEILLIVSMLFMYGMVLVFYKAFGKIGLFAWSAIITIAANIEVLLLVDAFGIEQTLGNVLFASCFLVSDILSENEGKADATLAVKIGIAINISFIILSQLWLLYTPSANDWARPHFEVIFSNTPRVMIAGLVVYALSQWLDVQLYHFIWKKANAIFKDSKKGLWLRNNFSTLFSQILNTVLFTLLAFYGEYENEVIVSIILSSYLIFVITSICDTPIVYLSRLIKKSQENHS